MGRSGEQSPLVCTAVSSARWYGLSPRLVHCCHHSAHGGQFLLHALLTEPISPIILRHKVDMKKLTIASENSVPFEAHAIVPSAAFLSRTGLCRDGWRYSQDRSLVRRPGADLGASALATS